MFTDFSSSTVEAIAASYHTLSRILLMWETDCEETSQSKKKREKGRKTI